MKTCSEKWYEDIFRSTNYIKLFQDMCKLSAALEFKGLLSGFDDKLRPEIGRVNSALCEFAKRFGLKMLNFCIGPDRKLYFDYSDTSGVYIFAVNRTTGELIHEESRRIGDN